MVTVDSEPAIVSITVQTPDNIPTEQQKVQTPDNIPTEQQKDKDNDGIDDSIDNSPSSPSSEFSTKDKLAFGKIVAKGDQQVKIAPGKAVTTDSGLNITEIIITALPEGGNESASTVIEICGNTQFKLDSNETQPFYCRDLIEKKK